MLSDPRRLIAALARDRINLDLKTLDLCFLAGLYLRADRASLASFEEEVLIDMFEQTCEVVDPGAERPRKRATHAIQRLHDQRMLARVDGAGIVRSGEYTLTRLAAAVVEYFLADCPCPGSRARCTWPLAGAGAHRPRPAHGRCS